MLTVASDDEVLRNLVVDYNGLAMQRTCKAAGTLNSFHHVLGFNRWRCLFPTGSDGNGWLFQPGSMIAFVVGANVASFIDLIE